MLNQKNVILTEKAKGGKIEARKQGDEEMTEMEKYLLLELENQKKQNEKLPFYTKTKAEIVQTHKI